MSGYDEEKPDERPDESPDESMAERPADVWAKVTDAVTEAVGQLGGQVTGQVRARLSDERDRSRRMGHGHGGPGWGQNWGQGWVGAPGGPRGRGRPGPPPWVQELVRGFGGPDLGGGPRGPKVRRGDVRTAILDVLSREPMNGYQVIQQISEHTGGAWKPSPGSVYPTVQQLEDEGLVEGREVDGRRVLVLTDAGQAWVDDRPEELAATWRPFEATGEEAAASSGIGDLKPVVGQVMGAVWQIMVSGTDQQRAEAAEVLGETRRRLYGLLAEGEPE